MNPITIFTIISVLMIILLTIIKQNKFKKKSINLKQKQPESKKIIKLIEKTDYFNWPKKISFDKSLNISLTIDSFEST